MPPLRVVGSSCWEHVNSSTRDHIVPGDVLANRAKPSRDTRSARVPSVEKWLSGLRAGRVRRSRCGLPGVASRAFCAHAAFPDSRCVADPRLRTVETPIRRQLLMLPPRLLPCLVLWSQNHNGPDDHRCHKTLVLGPMWALDVAPSGLRTSPRSARFSPTTPPVIAQKVSTFRCTSLRAIHNRARTVHVLPPRSALPARATSCASLLSRPRAAAPVCLGAHWAARSGFTLHRVLLVVIAISWGVLNRVCS